ncbi:YdcF family protein [Alteromonas gracilis]|uniref:YdcF family protein n=1 Tax=Alteromonas gracilis TaxID=1479524 RepID=UPI0037352D81
MIILSVIANKLKKTKTAKWLLFSSVFVLLVFSQPWVANALLHPLEYNHDAQDSLDDVKYDAIFVPACYYQTNFELPEISRWHECSLQRLIQAKMLSDEHKLPIIVTGGNFLSDKSVKYSEKAESFLTLLGIAPENIVSIPEGADSLSEVEALSKLYRKKKLITVTSATHRIRIKQMLSQSEVESVIISVDFQSSGELTPFISYPSILALERTRRALYEYLAIAKYQFFEN